ncbi:thiol peroxidase [methane-oxidizing endosymbiont of Gigantopelta aegis]|uniref:thiol peroxidase n=1 Tax=methane-oxidizing endosymbiont of Gigantopelta aegis TaxID=2794938 RepID=UPI0018DCADA3|nr:thiol peroxidase [methane-oxidizing endosymbiont of Gigantopelta aegis]
MATITFQGKPIHTNGELPAVGSKAPDFKLVNTRLKEVSLHNYKGKTKLLNIVPSLDTPTCQISTRKFNQKAAKLDNTVVLVISADLPFAQSRFCESEGLKDIVPLSCFRASFAQDYGITLVDSVLKGLTARAVVIIDADNKVRYTELVSEIAEEPDYAAAWEALQQI